MPWCDAGRAQTLPVPGGVMPAVGMAPLLLPNPCFVSQQHPGDVRDHNHHLTPPLQQEFAACPAASSPLILVEVDAGGLLQQIHSGHWDKTGQPHTRHSPGPFQLSGSWGFSPGSGFSGSFGLSRASLDSAAGGGRQQVRAGHSRGSIPQGLGPPEQRHPGLGRAQGGDSHPPGNAPSAHPNTWHTHAMPCHASGPSPAPLTALFVAYS